MELAGEDSLVEEPHEPLEVLGRDSGHVERAKLRLNPLRPAASVGAHAGEPAPLALVEPRLEPLGHRLALGRLRRGRRGGPRHPLALGELGEDLGRLRGRRELRQQAALSDELTLGLPRLGVDGLREPSVLPGADVVLDEHELGAHGHHDRAPPGAQRALVTSLHGVVR